MKKFFVTLIIIYAVLLICGSYSSYCQSVHHSEGKLTIVASSELDTIMHKKSIYDSYNSGYNGYRVQIFFASGSNSKQLAFYSADSFDSLNLELPIFVTFREPYYRVRVGNFRNKIDADYFKSIISQSYSGAFVVKDFISPFDKPYIPYSEDGENNLLPDDSYQENIFNKDSSSSDSDGE